MIRLPVLADPFERRITYLRVSLTDRCNYRCTYCMPEHGVDLVPRPDILSYEELERLVRVFASLGVRRVRLTGGEPTIRRDLVVLVERLARVEGIEQVVMTTNGHRLADLADDLARAGLAEVNVSLDTLDAERFRAITRRGDLARVLAGVQAALAAGLRVKSNTVVLKGFNEHELGALCDWAWGRGIFPRFIEWMPMGEGSLYTPGSLLPASEIRARIQAHTGLPVTPETSAAQGALAVGPARRFRVDDRRGFGVISAMSEHFCDLCNRVRLTATGQLHACLAYDDGTDLRTLLRAGAPDESIAAAIAGAVGQKRQGHVFTATGTGGPRRHMVSIGG